MLSRLNSSGSGAPETPFQYPTTPLVSPTVSVADQMKEPEDSDSSGSATAVGSLVSSSVLSSSSVKETFTLIRFPRSAATRT